MSETSGFKLHLSTSVLTTLFMAIIGWGISVEVRMKNTSTVADLEIRLHNLEDALMPVLVEYRLDQELKRRGILPGAQPIPGFPPPIVTSAIVPEPELNAIRKEATDWANKRINVNQVPNTAK